MWESRSLCPFMYMAIAPKRHIWLLCGFLSLLDKRQSNEWFSSRGSGKTESGHRIGIFFNKAAKIVTLVINLNLHFVFWLSWVPCSLISIFSAFPWIVIKSALVQSKYDFSKKVLFYERRNIDIHQFYFFEELTTKKCWFKQQNWACWRLLQVSRWFF